MATISSNQEKKHALVDPIYVVAFLVVLLALLLLGPLGNNTSNSITGALGVLSGAPDGVSASEISFASDQQYWDANCSRGWSTDSTCETIVQRVQTCSVSTASAYCSEYDLYLQPFLRQ